MSDPIITFDHVVKEFKTRGRGANIARAVDDVSLTIDRGDIFGIIGYSGAGNPHWSGLSTRSNDPPPAL